MDLALLCGKISFIAIYAVLSQSMFCPDLRTFYVDKNCAQNVVRGGKITNVTYHKLSLSDEGDKGTFQP